jgi:hypothetical protein
MGCNDWALHYHSAILRWFYLIAFLRLHCPRHAGLFFFLSSVCYPNLSTKEKNHLPSPPSAFSIFSDGIASPVPKDPDSRSELVPFFRFEVCCVLENPFLRNRNTARSNPTTMAKKISRTRYIGYQIGDVRLRNLTLRNLTLVILRFLIKATRLLNLNARKRNGIVNAADTLTVYQIQRCPFQVLSHTYK